MCARGQFFIVFLEEFYWIRHENRGRPTKHLGTDCGVWPESSVQFQRERIDLAEAEEPTGGQ